MSWIHSSLTALKFGVNFPTPMKGIAPIALQGVNFSQIFTQKVNQLRDHETLTVGRNSECSINVAREFEKVSRQHLIVSKGKEGYQVQDAGSKHGTVLMRPVGPDRVQIQAGDELCFGRAHVSFDWIHRLKIGESLTIGRHPENQMVLNDSSVSGKHAILFRTPEGFFLVDRKSTNKTQIHRRLVAHQPTSLEVGDTLDLAQGSFQLNYLEQAQQRVPKKASQSFTSMPHLPQAPKIKLLDGSQLLLPEKVAESNKFLFKAYIKKGLKHIKNKDYVLAIEHFNNANAAEYFGFQHEGGMQGRAFGANSQVLKDSVAVNHLILNQAANNWFLPHEEKIKHAEILMLIRNPDRLDENQKRRYQKIMLHSALVHAEEWIHALQHLNKGPISKNAQSYAQKNGLVLTEEEDAAVYMAEQGIELPEEYWQRYNRMAFRPCVHSPAG